MKKLTPQEDSPVITSATVRQQVSTHMRTLLAAGAASASLIGCRPVIVCDALPPPAACSDAGTVSELLTGYVDSGVGQGRIDLVLESRVQGAYAGVQLNVNSVVGATAIGAAQAEYPDIVARLTLLPDSPTATIQVLFGASCNYRTTPDLRVTLTPLGADGGVLDAGFADGGVPSYSVQVAEVP